MRTRRQLTAFGTKVKKRLIDINMTQGELATLVGTSHSYLDAILFGKRDGAKYKDKIVKVLGLNSNKRTA